VAWALVLFYNSPHVYHQPFWMTSHSRRKWKQKLHRNWN